MDNSVNQNITTQSHQTISVPSDGISYAYTDSYVVAPQVKSPEASLSFLTIFSFYFSEYFKGFLFVVLSSVYIFAVPKLLTERKRISLVMKDFIKRTFDIIGSLVGIILTLPLWLIIPVMIKLDSSGPVLYSQTRVGLNRRKNERRGYQKTDVDNLRNDERRQQNGFGSVFKVYKFRTMVNDAEKKSGPVWATKDDPRVTKVGAFLRKSRIDEIPQFFNVLKGEMSIVGPRPERPEFVTRLNDEVENYAKRLLVKPGITGLAQVSNGYDDSISSVVQKVKHDMKYINNRSFWLDTKILFLTVWVMFTGKGAR